MQSANLTPDRWQESLCFARAGQREPLGQILDDARNYLRVIAARMISPDVRGKLSGSDLVQDSLCKAQRDFAQFKGQTREELLGWLRGILVHNLLNQHRQLRGTQMRNIGRELYLEDCRRGGSRADRQRLDGQR